MEQCAKQRKLLADKFIVYKKVFIALGDETRQPIFIALLEHENVGMPVPKIKEPTHLSRPAVSHHFQILKDAERISQF